MSKPLRITKKELKRGEDNYKVISVRIDVTILDNIEKIAGETNRSRNELINILLKNSLEDVIID